LLKLAPHAGFPYVEKLKNKNSRNEIYECKNDERNRTSSWFSSTGKQQ